MAFNLRNEMTVRSQEGDKLGKIIDFSGDRIIIEKGFFFPKDFIVPVSQIETVSGDEVYLKWGTELVETQYDESYGAGAYQSETAGEDWRDYERPPQQASESETSVPLKEERVNVESRGMRERGRVRIHKTVKTEDKHFTVPVRREEIRVEREPVQGEARAASGEFGEQDVSVPVREEQIEVTKRPVETERIHLRKEAHTDEQEVREQVRKEQAEVREEGRP